MRIFSPNPFTTNRILPVLHATCILLIGMIEVSFGQQPPPFGWPEGKSVAISLTFDDARDSQVQGGTELLDQYGVKATFFVLPSGVERKLAGWKQAVASGHEIGNHSLNHPCSGNFLWARDKALENYTTEQMKSELLKANEAIERLLGVEPRVFAYPCGQTFVGRGAETQSYVPVVAESFLLGRTWMNEAPNDPAFCDFAQLTGMEMDGKNFDEISPLIESARQNHQWLVLAGHEMNESGAQTTRLSMLKELLEYAKDPSHGVWIAPVGVLAEYVDSERAR
jgi:peptidoglycan/xylan/chitin deacetylase (PgdA/CDA1 family)